MKLKCLLIGDPHIIAGDSERIKIMIDNVVKIAEDCKPDFIVILGDVFDSHNIIKLAANRKVVDFLARLIPLCHVYILVGNHDRENNSVFCTRDHSLAAFEYWPNVTVVWKPTQTVIQTYKFTFIPYVPPERFEEALAMLGKKKKWYDSVAVFAHNHVKGCKMGPKECTDSEGIEWPEDYPTLFSGHNHEYQYVNSNVFYPGNLYQIKCNENTNKSVSLIVFDEDGWEDTKFVTEVPCRLNTTVNVEQFLEMDPPQYDIVKIIIRDTDANLSSISQCKKIKEFRKMGFVISPVPISQKILDVVKNTDDEEMDLVERTVEDYDELLYKKVLEEDRGVRTEFKTLFPEILKKFEKKEEKQKNKKKLVVVDSDNDE